MSDRRRLSELFENIAQQFLEISRIMSKQAMKDEKVSKREMAIENKIERMEIKSKQILDEASKPFPDMPSEVIREMIKTIVKE